MGGVCFPEPEHGTTTDKPPKEKTRETLRAGEVHLHGLSCAVCPLEQDESPTAAAAEEAPMQQLPRAAVDAASPRKRFLRPTRSNRRRAEGCDRQATLLSLSLRLPTRTSRLCCEIQA